MADPRMALQIPRQSAIYLLFCLAGVLLFIFAGILPNNRTMANTAVQIAEAHFRLDEQKTLGPFRKTLEEKSAKKESEVLPLPARGKLARAKLNTLHLIFGDTARMSGMTLVSAVPSLNALTGDAQALPVNVVLKGEFINFRKFLIQLGAIPYMQQIEEIAIQQKSDAKEFKLKIWVAVG